MLKSLPALATLAGCLLLSTGCSKPAADAAAAEKTTDKGAATSKDTQKSASKAAPAKQAPAAAAGKTGTPGGPRVVLTTNVGKIELELFEKEAPISTANFLQYVDDKAYDGTVFHRVIPTFMVQGGGFDEKMTKRPVRDMIKNEATNGLTNARGTVSMARTGVIDSATNQFFINVVDNARLDHRGSNPRAYGYAVFGHVVSGMDVVDKIRAVETGACPPNFRRDCPQTPMVIQTARRK